MTTSVNLTCGQCGTTTQHRCHAVWPTQPADPGIRVAARQASGQQPDTDAALFHAEGEHDRCGAECEPDRLRAALEDARMWARHGYEIGQRSCTWSDHGVAPAWLTDGWPVHFPGPDPAAAHCCGNCDGIDPDRCLTNPDRPKLPPMDPAAILGVAPDYAEPAPVARSASGVDTPAVEVCPPRVRWAVEHVNPRGGTVMFPGVDDRSDAEERRKAAQVNSPESSHRLVRETTTWTVEEDETR
ncbi:hypothetical protein J3A78_002356 [Streptomyces sp. PvR006]|uniref:hypothetical protein n=1 Tax=Streptomyces sp. PvR006 TaxID=2817860 RepID=UPI001AEA61C9|nr:hypothetical protein [Streptomyces sp. PvR006]MBP2581878.1 hypothetical protein [Streptomyces sp. PvR006]